MYNIEIRLQPPRQEIISNLTEIMIIQLKYFYEKTKYQPQRIIYYRYNNVHKVKLIIMINFDDYFLHIFIKLI
jgi:hypothetical protein